MAVDNSPDDISMPGDAEGEDSDDGAEPDDVTPIVELQEHFTNGQEKIREADDAGEAMREALEAVSNMAETKVESDDDTVEPVIDAYLSDLANGRTGITKTQLKQHLQQKTEQVEHRKAVENGEVVEFDEHLNKELMGVTKRRWSDRSGTEGPSFQLEFVNARDITVPEGVLFDERKLWQAYTAAQDRDYPERAGMTGEDGAADWDDYIGGILSELEEVETETGPRTTAVHALENHISNATAYGNIPDTVEQGGVYVDAEPPEHTEVRVPREAVASILSTHELSDRALQEELAARGVTSPALAGDTVSQSTTVNGRWQTFWCVSGDRFEVDEESYFEEAPDKMDRMGAAPSDDGADTGVDVGELFSFLFSDDAGDDGSSSAGNRSSGSGSADGSPGYGRMDSFGGVDADDDDADNGGEE